MNLSLITSAILDNLRRILFSNPATVEGTMERLKYHASQQQKTLDLEVIVINNTFDLYARIKRGLRSRGFKVLISNH